MTKLTHVLVGFGALQCSLALYGNVGTPHSAGGCSATGTLKNGQINAARATVAGCLTDAEADTKAPGHNYVAPDTPPPAAKLSPTQMSMPMPSTTDVPSPSLEGLAPVPSGLKIADLVQPSWGSGDLPKPEAPGVEGAFRFLCAPGQLSYDDPIAYPGRPGKSHLHLWFGNTLANAYSTYSSLRTTGDSTCNSMGNRSAYWMPAMMHPTGKVVMPDNIFVYYKRAPGDSIYCKPPYAKACLGLPRGLRYVFGYNMLDPKTTPTDVTERWFNCDVPGLSGHYPTIAAAGKNCPVGAKIGAIVVSANCWNGVQLDSPDHRSHMAFRRQDGFGRAVCPKTHPYLLPFFELGAWFTNDGTAARWKLSSDMDLPGGTTLHGDWFGAWEDSLKDRWIANCIDKALSCSGGDLGDGAQLKTLAGYDYPSGRPMLDPPTR